MTRDGPRDWPAIRLEIGPSRTLAALLVLPYALAALAIAGLPGPPSLCVAAIAACAWLAVRAVREHGLRTARGSIRGLEWRSDGRWRLDLVGEGDCRTRLARRGFVHPALVVIGLEGPGRRTRTLILGAGNVDVDGLRRLRVRLLLGRGTPAPGSRRRWRVGR